MNFEEEVEKILDNIRSCDIKTEEEIHINRNRHFDNIFEDYLFYESNIETKKILQEKLKDYEYITDFDHVSHNNYIYMIDTTEFYNIKHKQLGFYIKQCINNEKHKILVRPFKMLLYYCVTENRHFFKKISKKDKLKMLLIETIENTKLE